MRRLRGSRMLEAALFVAALALCAAAVLGLGHDETLDDTLYFAAWCAAMLLLFSLGLRLPLHLRGRLGSVANVGIVIAAAGLTFVGSIALYRHDAHFDVTVNERYTAPPELETIARSLRHDVLLTYFYNTSDEYAEAAKEVLAVVARQHPHLRVRALDLDTELAAARQYGVKLYNTAVVEAEGRRTQVENTVDLRQVAYAIERVLKARIQTVCFVTGHGERYAPGHVHLSHVEGLNANERTGVGASVLEAPLDGIDRLKLAIETIGYSDRAIEPVTLTAIPQDCAVVADLGPRDGYTPGEVRLLKDYLGRGGRVLLAYDPQFPVSPDLTAMLAEVGLAVEDGVVVDPTNHYGTDPEQAAVPFYAPHPITMDIALTVFPGARPIRLLQPVDGITAAPLVATSKDSYVRPLNPTATVSASTAATGPQLLAAALTGNWPGNGQAPFRLVLVGNAGFAANAFFPYASNGDLAVSMIRWLAMDTTTPLLKPTLFSTAEMRLTHRQMQATFLILVVLMPLSVIFLGAFVWWRRR
jgi:ABC-2 type transport system permease protein